MQRWSYGPSSCEARATWEPAASVTVALSLVRCLGISHFFLVPLVFGSNAAHPVLQQRGALRRWDSPVPCKQQKDGVPNSLSECPKVSEEICDTVEGSLNSCGVDPTLWRGAGFPSGTWGQHGEFGSGALRPSKTRDHGSCTPGALPSLRCCIFTSFISKE